MLEVTVFPGIYSNEVHQSTSANFRLTLASILPVFRFGPPLLGRPDLLPGHFGVCSEGLGRLGPGLRQAIGRPRRGKTKKKIQKKDISRKFQKHERLKYVKMLMVLECFGQDLDCFHQDHSERKHLGNGVGRSQKVWDTVSCFCGFWGSNPCKFCSDSASLATYSPQKESVRQAAGVFQNCWISFFPNRSDLRFPAVYKWWSASCTQTDELEGRNKAKIRRKQTHNTTHPKPTYSLLFKHAFHTKRHCPHSPQHFSTSSAQTSSAFCNSCANLTASSSTRLGELYGERLWKSIGQSHIFLYFHV